LYDLFIESALKSGYYEAYDIKSHFC